MIDEKDIRPHGALIVAATDSGGCAGICADMRVAAALGVFATCCVTAVTAQSSLGVKNTAIVAPTLLHSQIECAMEQHRPSAVKVGLMPSATSIVVLAEAIEEFNLPNIVVDPVAAASAGSLCECGESEWLMAMRSLMHKVQIVTPNLPELELLTDIKVNSKKSMSDAANCLMNDFGVKYVLVKGGHGCNADKCIDYLFMPHTPEPTSFLSQKICSENLRGTGCTLSSAITCFLARNMNINESVKLAHKYMNESINAAKHYKYDCRKGPVEHFPSKKLWIFT